MASREPVALALAGRHFAVRPLTLGQVERIEAALAAGAGPIATGVDVVAVALSRDHDATTPAALREMEIGAAELAVAMTAVLRQGGFLPAEDARAGERPAAARTDAPTGAPSADA